MANAIPSPSDDREILKVPLVGEDGEGAFNQVPRSQLVQIIQPRLEETFELVRSRMEAHPFDKVTSRRVVLTGGASQMQGVRDLASMILDKQVRLGRPLGIHGLPEANAGPAFSTCAGLLHYAMTNHVENTRPADHTGTAAISGQFLGRLTSWLRRNFLAFHDLL